MIGRLVNVGKLCVAGRCVRRLRADLDQFVGGWRLGRVFFALLAVGVALFVSKDNVPLFVLLA